MKIIRKILGVICLILGVLLFGSFLLASILEGVINGQVDFANFILLIGIPMIVGGAALYDWSKKEKNFGIVSTVLGGICGLFTVGFCELFPVATIIVRFKDLKFEGISPFSGKLSPFGGKEGDLAIVSAILAVIFLIIGIALIIRGSKETLSGG